MHGRILYSPPPRSIDCRLHKSERGNNDSGHYSSSTGPDKHCNDFDTTFTNPLSNSGRCIDNNANTNHNPVHTIPRPCQSDD